MHDLTIRRRQSNYDKHLNAIVWLYCGEVDKYAALLREYRTVLGSDKPFAEQVHELSEQAKALRVEAKKAVETAEKREKKKIQEEYDLRLAEITDMLTVTSEAWGEYGVNTPQLAAGKFMCARRAHVLTGESPESARQWEGYSRTSRALPRGRV